jgi:hypothetical protein
MMPVPAVLRVLVLAALIAGLAAPVLGARSPAAAAPAPSGTPVLGASLLGPDQMAGWYASTGITSRSPTDVRRLAELFVTEGAAQGVRGDLAFAQAMLETGYLRFGGQVRPTDHNFSGLGACDSCPRGLTFPSPELGVRAQIQHLWAYAMPGADPAQLARPLADVRFGLVRPPGKAPLWEMMGGGNWATDPGYAGKVLRIWRAMLAWAGVPEPGPSTGASAPLMVRTAASGAANLGGWPLRRGSLSVGAARLGPPARLVRAARVCLARWPALGAAVQLAADGPDPCDGTATARWARLAGSAWRTQRGLAPGDSVARMKRLYPAARLRGGRWWLVSGREAGRRAPVPRLRAEVRSGRVRALWLHVAPASRR